MRFVQALAGLTLIATGCRAAALTPEAPPQLTAAAAYQHLRALAVPFVPNGGQWDAQAAFGTQTFAGTLFVSTAGQLVYSLHGKRTPIASGGDRTMPRAVHRPRARTPGWVLTETVVDAAGRAVPVRPRGEQPQPEKVSYALGSDDATHRDGLATYGRVQLGEVYPGISLALRATGDNVEKIFTVGPGRDPGAIALRLEGAERLEVDANGALIAHTGNGPVTYTAPIAYQEDAEGRHNVVAARYALDASAQRYGFAVGAYDPAQALIIDPLLQSTYLGGDGDEGTNRLAMAVHPATGDVYVAGDTRSTDFPKVAGAEQPNAAGNADIFVTRLNAALTSRLQSTYLGGTNDDFAYAVAIHPDSGEVYVTGYTYSTDFPKVAGAEQVTKSTVSDVFVTRLDAALTTLLQSTYIGGTGDDVAHALAIHPSTGEVYVAGYTSSTNFPAAAGAEQITLGGINDGFVARLNAALTTRLQSTYLGSIDDDFVHAMAIHPFTGEIYVAGETRSVLFPKTSGAEQPGKEDLTDGFVTRLNAALTARLQSTYLGGEADDYVYGMAIHPHSGEIYVTGATDTFFFFPKLLYSEQPNKGASLDAFVTRLNASLTDRLQSTYLGGNGSDIANSLQIHPATGEVYVVGYTTSTNFPKVAGGEQASAGLDTPAFVTRLNAALTTRLQSTYLGGTGTSSAEAVAIHPATGEVYVAGWTFSGNFPKVAGAEQTTLGSTRDAFVSRFSLELMAGDKVPDPFSFAPKLNVPPGSEQTSAPTQILGIAGLAPISISGGAFGQYCVSSSGASCDCIVVPFTIAPGTIADGQFVCVRQRAPLWANGVNQLVLNVGGGYAPFTVGTGTNLSVCELDIDGNGAIDALTDGLMLLRAMFGLTGSAVTNSAVGDGATRNTWALIRAYLNGDCGASFAP